MDVNLDVALVVKLNVCCSLSDETRYIYHLVSMIGNVCVCTLHFLNGKQQQHHVILLILFQE